MKVLVIRPKPSAERTAAKLTALGHTPAILPIVTPVHDTDATLAALSRQHSAIAITSAEAGYVLKSTGAELDRHLLTTVFAVGHATARSAIDAGFRTVLTAEGGDGESLANLIIEHRLDYGVPPEPLLYLAGAPRSKQFETRLAAAGVAFETVECYRMEPTNPKRAELRPHLVDERPDAVLLYSREAARRFFELPLVTEHLDNLEDTLFLCLSRNVAAEVPSRFSKSIVVSMTPTEEGLLDLL